MFNTFNNQSIRKLVVAFGSLFDEIYVTRKNDTTDVEEKIKVPITFASKEKFLRRLETNSSISDTIKTQINLPYLSFDVSSIAYDYNRKRNKLKFASNNVDEDTTYKTFSETPVQIGFTLFFYTRSLDELFQIIEQIMAYFNPEFNLRINFNDVFQNINVPISFREVKFLDDYEGEFKNRRVLIGTISFAASSYVFGEIKTGLPSETAIFNITALDATDDDATQSISSVVINPNYLSNNYDLTGSDSSFITNFTWTVTNPADKFNYVQIYQPKVDKAIATLQVSSSTTSLTQAEVDSLREQISNALNLTYYDNTCINPVLYSFTSNKQTFVIRVSNGTYFDQVDSKFQLMQICE